MSKIAVFLSLLSLFSFADDYNLKPRTKKRDQPPHFFEIYVYERVNQEKGVIELVQEWEYRWREYGTLYAKKYGPRVLEWRPIPEPPQAAPEAVQPEEEAPAAKPDPPSEGPKGGSRKDPKRVNRPKGAVKPADIPPVRKFRVNEPALTAPPDPLVKTIPAAIETIDWSEMHPIASDKERIQLDHQLRALAKSFDQWQMDLQNRFDLCSLDQYYAEKKGTLEAFYVPFHVSIGRVFLVASELKRLVFLIKDAPVVEWAADFVRVSQRAQDLLSHLDELKKNGELKYEGAIRLGVAGLWDYSETLNPFGDLDSMAWVARWQLIVEDLQVWRENYLTVSSQIDGKLKKESADVARSIDDLMKHIGDAPWERDFEEQRKLARSINEATTQLFDLYKDAGDFETAHGDGEEYLSYLSWLGANEDLRVYTAAVLNAF